MSNRKTEEKVQVVKRYLEGNDSYRDLAQDAGIDEGEIRYWV
ncbi:transposase [Oceanobacillus rekensis]|nr:transposase [Oceanobacillus rekensis]